VASEARVAQEAAAKKLEEDKKKAEAAAKELAEAEEAQKSDLQKKAEAAKAEADRLQAKAQEEIAAAEAIATAAAERAKAKALEEIAKINNKIDKISTRVSTAVSKFKNTAEISAGKIADAAKSVDAAKAQVSQANEVVATVFSELKVVNTQIASYEKQIVDQGKAEKEISIAIAGVERLIDVANKSYEQIRLEITRMQTTYNIAKQAAQVAANDAQEKASIAGDSKIKLHEYFKHNVKQHKMYSA
jgi:chromosome segregation ATPase